MSDYPSPMPEYQPLFHQVQNFIADQLNSDPQLSGIGVEFLPESQLDIEYGIKRNLGRQGMVGIVNTLRGTYGGHDQDSCAWEIEAEIDCLENPPVRRAWLKQKGLSAGTTVDVLNYIQESLCGPASPTYGKFCPVTQEVGEDNGIVVGKAVVKTFAIADVSACVSGESNWHLRYATEADISALWDAVNELSAELSGSQEVWNAISALNASKRDYIDLSLDASGRVEGIDPLLPQGGVDSFYLEWTNPRGRIDTIDMVQFSNEDGTMSWESQYEPYEVTYDAESQKFNLLERGTSILEFTGLPSEGIPVQINWEWLDEPYVFDAHLKFHAISTALATMMDLEPLSQKVDEIDDLAVKYTDAEKVHVVLSQPNTPVTLTINDSVVPGSSTIQFPGTNHISQKSLTLGVPPDGMEASAYGNTNVQFGGTHNDADLILGAGIHLISSTEKGKSQILMDDQRLYVVTPEEVSAGQTLKAVKVYDDPTLNAMSFRGMKTRDEPRWHWEYESANLPDKTSDLSNDSGFITSSEVSAEISAVVQNLEPRLSAIEGDVSALSTQIEEVSAQMPTLWRVWEYDTGRTSLTFTATQANSTVKLKRVGNPPNCSFEYSTDNGQNWGDMSIGTTYTLSNIGDSISIRAKTPQNTLSSNGYNNCHRFETSGGLKMTGSLHSLLTKDWETTPITMGEHALETLCQEMAAETDISELLPLDWPQNNQNYRGLFWHANVVGAVPRNLLPSTTVGESAYLGFFENTHITNAPDLPATTLGGYCYADMFYGCTSLTKAPYLPATSLEAACYREMFWGCTSLNEIKIGYTGNFPGSQYVPAFDRWVLDVPSGGTFYYNGSDTTRGSSAIPDNWTVQTF